MNAWISLFAAQDTFFCTDESGKWSAEISNRWNENMKTYSCQLYQGLWVLTLVSLALAGWCQLYWSHRWLPEHNQQRQRLMKIQKMLVLLQLGLPSLSVCRTPPLLLMLLSFMLMSKGWEVKTRGRRMKTVDKSKNHFVPRSVNRAQQIDWYFLIKWTMKATYWFGLWAAGRIFSISIVMTLEKSG